MIKKMGKNKDKHKNSTRSENRDLESAVIMSPTTSQATVNTFRAEPPDNSSACKTVDFICSVCSVEMAERKILIKFRGSDQEHRLMRQGEDSYIFSGQVQCRIGENQGLLYFMGTIDFREEAAQYGGWGYNKPFRTWYCDDKTVVLAAVFRDIPTMTSSKLCDKEDFLRGCFHLIQATSTFVQGRPLPEFYCALKSALEALYVRKPPDFGSIQITPDLELHSNFDESMLMKWVFTYNEMRRIAPKNKGLRQLHRVALEKINPALTVSHLLSDETSFEILNIWHMFSLEIMNLGDERCISWALLLYLIGGKLTQNTNTADSIQPAYRFLQQKADLLVKYLPPFMPYLANDALLRNVFPNVRSLKSFVMEMGSSFGLEIQPATIQAILKNHFYDKNPLSKEEKLLEFQAIMHFVVGHAEMLYEIFNSSTCFKILSIRHLNIEGLAEEALYPILTNNVPVSMKNHWVRDFCEEIQPRLEDDDSAVGEVCTVIETLFATLGSTEAANELILPIHNVLPRTVGAGFSGRLEAFLQTKSVELLWLERAALREVFLLESNDLFDIRGYLLEEYATDYRCPVRFSFLLGLLWEVFLVRYKSDPSVASNSVVEKMNACLENEELKKPDDHTGAVLVVDIVREHFVSLQSEVNKFSQLRENCDPLYAAMLKSYFATLSSLEMMAKRVIEMDVSVAFLQVVRQDQKILRSLANLIPMFDINSVDFCWNKVNRVRGEWEDLLVCFRHYMPEQRRFRDYSLEQAQIVEAKVAELEKKRIKDWESPSLGGQGMRELAENVTKAQSSLLFRSIWLNHCQQEEALEFSGNPCSPIEQWQASLLTCLEEWREVILKIFSQEFRKSTLLCSLCVVLEDDPPPPEYPIIPVQAQDCIARHLRHVEQHRRSRLEAEVHVAVQVLQEINVDTDILIETMLNFLAACAFASQAEHFQKLTQKLGCHLGLDDPFIYFLQFFSSEKSETSTVAEVVHSYKSVQVKYPPVLQIPPKFPALLLKLIEEGGESRGLLNLLCKCKDAILLNQMCARLITQIKPHEQVLLKALQDAREAFDVVIAGQSMFNEFVGGKMKNPANVFEYLSAVSWFIAGIGRLSGGIVRIFELLDDGLSETSAISLVRELMTSGQFMISLPGAKTTASFVQIDGLEKVLSPEDLGDIPFQLCLLASNEDEGGEAQREQKYFLRFLELLSTLSQALFMLCEEGHPNYQDCQLTIPSTVPIEELEDMLAGEKNVLCQWQQFLLVADAELPLLTCLSRKQLVDSIRLMATKTDVNALSQLLRSVFPEIGDTVARKTTQMFMAKLPSNQDISTKVLSSQVHELLEEGVGYLFSRKVHMHQALKTAYASYRKNLPTEILNLRVVSVLNLLSSDASKQTESICALYIALFERLPSAIEVFVCDENTTELAVVDFVRRWVAANKFPIPQTHKLMFSMIQIEHLKTNIQSSLLSNILNSRGTAETPLLIMGACEVNTNSVLCSGLRKDWITNNLSSITDSSALCSLFLQMRFPLVQVFSSRTPSSGKTTSVLESFAVSQYADKRIPYARIPICGDLNKAVSLLSDLERCRATADLDGGIVLHLNVANSLDTNLLNKFVFSFFILGVLVDARGCYLVRNRNDTIAIEMPSEGVILDEAMSKCVLLNSFSKKDLINYVMHYEYSFVSLSRCVNHEHGCLLYYVEKIPKEGYLIGLKMMQAFFNVPKNECIMPFQDSIADIDLPDAASLYNDVLARISSSHLQPTSGTVFRFLNFLTNQLFGLYHFPYYESCSEALEREDDADRALLPESHSRNYRKLAYHLAKCSYNLAFDLAASAVPPMSNEFVENDTRLENLSFSFSGWKAKNFLIFNGGGQLPDMINSNGDIFLDSIMGEHKDEVFSRFLRTVHEGKAGKSIQALCSQLSDVHYCPEEDLENDHAIRRLVLMLGHHNNFGFRIFEALKTLHDTTNRPQELSPDKSIINMTGLLASAREELQSIIIQHDITGCKLTEQDRNPLPDESYISDFIDRARDWFRSITGSYTGNSPPFVLTVDNLIRLLAIKIRLACKIPVVFMGETGCGKTQLAVFYSRVSGSFSEVINVHGGMHSEELLHRVMSIAKKAEGKRVVILLDEVNSMPSVWTIKELVCDGFIMGRCIPPNLHFICLMNPRRRRQISSQQLESGLPSPYQTSSTSVQEKFPPLVYEVHRSPEALMGLVWDFGSPSESFLTVQEAAELTHNRTVFSLLRNICEETLFTENIVHWMITAKLERLGGASGLLRDFTECEFAENGGIRHYKYLRVLLCGIVQISQRFIRSQNNGEISAASLRDVARTITLIPFLIICQERFAELHDEEGYAEHGSFARGKGKVCVYFSFLNVAVQVSLILNYGMKLTRLDRQKYLEEVRQIWADIRAHHTSISSDFLPVPQDSKAIYRIFDEFACKLCGALTLEEGMAVNEALKENVTSLFCSLMGNQDTGIAQFIVGRPGSTKSSSLDILCSSTDPKSDDRRARFFQTGYWPQIRKFVLQCTPDTTAQDINRVAVSAANYQLINQNCQCVVVLEEVGVTVGSVHNPLMVLHGLVDRGVLMPDGTYVRLPIVGISNWRLDASKMNRMRTTYRGNPSVEDLIQTAHSIMRGKAGPRDSLIATDISNFDRSLSSFAQKFSRFVLSDVNASEDIKELAWFYGMRDFYSFVQLLQLHHSLPLAKEMGTRESLSRTTVNNLDPHLVRWTTQIAFGGHPDKRLEKMLVDAINNSFFSKAELEAQTANWYRLDSLDGSSVHVCDMCARMAHYTDVKISDIPPQDIAQRRNLFQEKITVAGRGRGRCARLEVSDPFPTLQILSYLLNVQTGVFSNMCKMRHILLFTRANAALHLLHSLRIVRQDQVMIIFGRYQPTTKDVLEDILKVRRCMLSGRTLILVGAKHLYESLYDALNLHYTVEGEGENKKYFTCLTMNGFTAYFPIHSSFRCIVIEQESTCRNLLPPFINRFAKAHLNYCSALTVPQSNLARLIRAHAEIPTPEGMIDLLPLLISGFTKDTIDSLCFLFSSERLSTATDIQEAAEFCLYRLSYLCSPRRLQQLAMEMFEGFSNDRAQEVIKRWTVARTHCLCEDVKILDSRQLKWEMHWQHLFLTTEQLVDFTSVIVPALSKVFPGSELAVTEPLNLNFGAFDNEIADFLSKLEETKEKEGFSVAFFNSNAQNCVDQVERFFYLVNLRNLPSCKHIVLIGLMRNSSIPQPPSDLFHLHMDAAWMYMFIDEISSLDHQFISTRLDVLLDNSIEVSSVVNDEFFCRAIIYRARSIAQRVEYTKERIEKLEGAIVEAFSSPLAVQRIIARIKEQFYTIEALKRGQWRRIALKRVRQTDSLFQQLYFFLTSFVERCILQFSTPLFGFENMRHSTVESDFHDVFSSIFGSHLVVVQPDLAQCVHIHLPLVSAWKDTATPDGLFSDRTQPVHFPFSFLLYQYLKGICSAFGARRVDDRLSEIIGECLSSEAVCCYICDIFTQKGLTESRSQNAAIGVLKTVFPEASNSIGGFHEFIHAEAKKFEALIRFVSSPCVNLDVLSQIGFNDATNTLLTAALDQDGIINLGVIPDLVVINGNCFAFELHKAVAVGVHQSLVDRNHAAEFCNSCRHDITALLKQLKLYNPTALSLSKFLLPILYQHIPEQVIHEVITDLLEFLLQDVGKFEDYIVHSILEQAIKLWHQIQNPQVMNLLAHFISSAGADSSGAVLISRCCFDICKTMDQVSNFLKKCPAIEDKDLQTVILSGIITAGIDILCERLRMGEPTDDSVLIFSQCLDENIPDLLSFKKGVALFAVRALSLGGVELDVAKEILGASSRVLPSCIQNDMLVRELCHPVTDQPSILSIFPDYIRGKILCLQILSQQAPPSDEQICDFENLNEVGALACLLDVGFCCSRNRSSQQLLFLQKLVVGIKEQTFNKLAKALISDQNFLLNEMSELLKSTWVCALLLIFTKGSTFFGHFLRIIACEPKPVQPFPTVSDETPKKKLASLVARFLHSVAALASSLLCPQPELKPQEHTHHRNHICDNILTNKCPACQKAMLFWPGCFAVTCLECGGNFCGWCFTVTNGDAHPHVLACVRSLAPGTYWGTEAQYNLVRNSEKIDALRLYVNSQQQEQRNVILDTCLKEIVDVGISEDALDVNAVIYSSKVSLRRLKSTVSRIESELFQGSLSEEPVMCWLQGILGLDLFPLDRNYASHEALNNVISDCIPDSATEVLDRIRTKITQVSGEASSNIVGVITWNQEFELSVEELTPPEKSRNLHHHFAFRRRISEEMMWHHVQNTELSLLMYLRDNVESLELSALRRMVQILSFMGDVIHACSTCHMTRNEATNTTLLSLAKEFQHLSGDRLKEFCENVKFIYDKIEQYECKDKGMLNACFGTVTAVSVQNMSLSTLLPQTSKGEVSLLPVLFKGFASDPETKRVTWRSIGMIQNEAVGMMCKFGSVPHSAAQRPFALTEDDILSFDLDNDLLRLASMYIDPQPVPKFTSDFASLQWQVIHGPHVWGKPNICESLPEFIYQDEKMVSCFEQLALCVEQQLPKAIIHARLATAVNKDSNFSHCCLEFLTVLAVEIASRPPAAIPATLHELAETIDIPLTEDQKQGKMYLSSPLFAMELQPMHIVSVCGLLWEGGVCDGACRPLPEEEVATLKKELKDMCQDPVLKLCSPFLRLGLRLLGMKVLSFPQTDAYLRTPFDVCLEMVMGQHFDEYLNESFFARTPICHFEIVFEVADKFLTASLISDRNLGGDLDKTSFEVHLTALKPFLLPQSHPTTAPLLIQHKSQDSPAKNLNPILLQESPTSDKKEKTTKFECLWRGRGRLLVLDSKAERGARKSSPEKLEETCTELEEGVEETKGAS